MLTEVGWAWLVEALDDRGAAFRAESGTVTRTASESFGAISDRAPSGDVEIRASWTPTTPDVGAAPARRGPTCWPRSRACPPLPPGVASAAAARAAADPPLPRPRRDAPARYAARTAASRTDPCAALARRRHPIG